MAHISNSDLTSSWSSRLTAPAAPLYSQRLKFKVLEMNCCLYLLPYTLPSLKFFPLVPTCLLCLHQWHLCLSSHITKLLPMCFSLSQFYISLISNSLSHSSCQFYLLTLFYTWLLSVPTAPISAQFFLILCLQGCIHLIITLFSFLFLHRPSLQSIN